MEQQPTSERFPIAPIVLGGLSLFGICLVLLLVRFLSNQGSSLPEISDTSTPFKYLLIGTEPGISTIDPLATELPIIIEEGSTASVDSDIETTNTPKPGFAITAQQGANNSSSSSNSSQSQSNTLTPTISSGSSSSVETILANPSDAPVIVLNPKTPSATSGVIRPSRTPTLTFTPRFTPTITPSRTKSPTQTQGTVVPTLSPTRTPTSGPTAPLGAGTYDNTDSRIVYSGGWLAQSNTNAFQGSLHVSNTVANPRNTITFRFIGTEVRLFYQSGPSLGEISISIDGLVFDLDQSDAGTGTSEWVSSLLVNGTHTVIITHTDIDNDNDGGSANLDYIIVPSVTP